MTEAEQKDELLLGSAQLIARLAISVKLHKKTAVIEQIETHLEYARIETISASIFSNGKRQLVKSSGRPIEV